MANARQQKQPKALIRRTLESAHREIEQIERKFHRTIKAVVVVREKQRLLGPGLPLVRRWAAPHRFRPQSRMC